MFVVVAKIHAKQGKGDQLAPLLAEMVEWVTENEADTLTYTCNRSTRDPDEFVFFERYTNKAAFEAHSASERFATLADAVGALVDAPPSLDTYDEVAVKL